MTVMTEPLPRPRGVRIYLAGSVHHLDHTLKLIGHIPATDLIYWICYGPPMLFTGMMPRVTIEYLPARTAIHLPVATAGAGLYTFVQPDRRAPPHPGPIPQQKP